MDTEFYSLLYVPTIIHNLVNLGYRPRRLQTGRRCTCPTNTLVCWPLAVPYRFHSLFSRQLKTLFL